MRHTIKFLWVIVFVLIVNFVIVYAVDGTTWPFTHKPTADELYGCTVAQQAPNGECK